MALLKTYWGVEECDQTVQILCEAIVNGYGGEGTRRDCWHKESATLLLILKETKTQPWISFWTENAEKFKNWNKKKSLVSYACHGKCGKNGAREELKLDNKAGEWLVFVIARRQSWLLPILDAENVNEIFLFLVGKGLVFLPWRSQILLINLVFLLCFS